MKAFFCFALDGWQCKQKTSVAFICISVMVCGFNLDDELIKNLDITSQIKFFFLVVSFLIHSLCM